MWAPLVTLGAGWMDGQTLHPRSSTSLNTNLKVWQEQNTQTCKQNHEVMSCNSAEKRVFVWFTLQEAPMRPAALDTQRGKWEPCVNSLAADHVAQPPFRYKQRLPPSNVCAHTCSHIHTQPTIKLVLQHKFSKNVLRWAPKRLFESWPSAWSTTCLCFKTPANGNWCKK